MAYMDLVTVKKIELHDQEIFDNGKMVRYTGEDKSSWGYNNARVGSRRIPNVRPIPSTLVMAFKNLFEKKRYSFDGYLDLSLELGILTKQEIENHKTDNIKWSAKEIALRIAGEGYMILNLQYELRHLYRIDSDVLYPIALNEWLFNELSKSMISNDIERPDNCIGLHDWKYMYFISKWINGNHELAYKIAVRWLNQYKKEIKKWELRYPSYSRTYGLQMPTVIEMISKNYHKVNSHDDTWLQDYTYVENQLNNDNYK